MSDTKPPRRRRAVRGYQLVQIAMSKSVHGQACAEADAIGLKRQRFLGDLLERGWDAYRSQQKAVKAE